MPFVKGQSGNPKGRPRVGVAVATIVRATVDPEQLIKILFGLVQDMSTRFMNPVLNCVW